jgi:tyrosyl-tRNA synthetase
MSISDELMWKYYELVTDLTPSEIEKMRNLDENPRNFKVNLAKLIITDFHSLSAANYAEEHFVRQFVNKDAPDQIQEKIVVEGTYKLVDLLVQTDMVASKGEAKRLIEQGGVKLNGNKILNVGLSIQLSPNLIVIHHNTARGSEIDPHNNEVILQVGKRKFLKVKAV